jgi:hypothetical protein
MRRAVGPPLRAPSTTAWSMAWRAMSALAFAVQASASSGYGVDSALASRPRTLPSTLGSTLEAMGDRTVMGGSAGRSQSRASSSTTVRTATPGSMPAPRAQTSSASGVVGSGSASTRPACRAPSLRRATSARSGRSQPPAATPRAAWSSRAASARGVPAVHAAARSVDGEVPHLVGPGAVRGHRGLQQAVRVPVRCG